MSRNSIDRWNKCESKKAWIGDDAKHQAWGAAKLLMRNELRKGIVHRMTVYECKYSDDPTNPHFHVGTRQRPFVVGSYGAERTPREWATTLELKWTDADDQEAQTFLRLADEYDIDIMENYWLARKGGDAWSPEKVRKQQQRIRDQERRSGRRSWRR